MPFIKLTHRYTVSGVTCENTFHYFNASVLPTPLILSQIAGYWITYQLAVFLNTLTSEVQSINVNVFAPNLGYGVDYATDVPGEIALGSTETLGTDIAADIKRSVGPTYLNENGAPYTGNRGIRRGRFYLSGLPKDLMKSTGYNGASTYNTVFSAMLNAQDNPLPLGGASDTWYPNVVGLPLAAVPSTPSHPAGKDARPYVVAPIIGAGFAGWSDLHNREG